ncbi:MAG: chemotaxis protein CheW [Halanaerobiales bacterium]
MLNNLKKSENRIENSNQFIVFILNQQKFGINILQSREVIIASDLTSIPRSPDFIGGVINLREEIIPIIDLAKRFNLQKELKSEDDEVIIISVNNTLIGLKVKEVEDIKKIEPDKINKAPEVTQGINQDYIQGIARLDNELIILININSIFSSEEINQMQDLEAEDKK